jgi:hypothetical protein
MFAWHVHTVLILVAADHTGIRVGLLTNQRHLYLANVGLVGPNFEHSLILDLKKIALLAFH